ncbi:MAG: TatD family hydrolase, partial [Deltaproteobacteria bacterium]|nr:TatD family hydrolase [Deltaproteobacteria bacterium]
MTVFADTHTHLYLNSFDEDREEVVMRAVDAGVQYLFLPNIDSSSIADLGSLIAHHPGTCIGMIGLHPTSVKADYREQMGVIEMELRKNTRNYCAIGEIGIDLYWDKSFAMEQEDVFVRQLELALELRLPAIIHTRNSMDIALTLVEPFRGKGLTGIFHCFSGNIRQADRAIEFGFKLGIGGVVTFKNSGLQQVVQAVDLQHLLLETDAPYLAPVPFRGQRNEPAYIPYIAGQVAELKKITLSEGAEGTTARPVKVVGVDALGR